MILAIFLGLFAGSMTVEQIHYNKCEKANFPLPVCKLEKAMKNHK